jgi:hypothetical protein
MRSIYLSRVPPQFAIKKQNVVSLCPFATMPCRERED